MGQPVSVAGNAAPSGAEAGHPKPVALVVGAGAGLSAALARALTARDHEVVLAARDTSDLAALLEETGALAVDCDASDREDVARLFHRIDEREGALALAVYNPSARVRGPIAELDPETVERALAVTAYGAFLMAHHASKRMLESGTGTMLFTGASAGVKGFANSAPFAMGKFALRGLCQSLARELHPKGIHVGHIIIDGGIGRTPQHAREHEVEAPDSLLEPDAIAASFLHLVDQHRSAWSWEIELRPWTEAF